MPVRLPLITDRRRRREVAGLLAGMLAGLAVSLLWLAARGPVHPAAGSPIRPVTVRAPASAGPDPAALEQEWTTYSDRSTCADWAGGDEVYAVRLNASQLAWFFADTYLGPAGPVIGFSRIKGFVHNTVVVQTLTGRDSTFVTMTGGGACTGPDGPTSVVGPPAAPGAASDRYWNGAGIKLGGSVLEFYNQFQPGAAPYISDGTVIASFPVSQLSKAGRGAASDVVARPALTVLPAYTPPGGGGPILWGAALLREGGMVYIYGTQTPALYGGNRILYVARVAASRLTQFPAWRFYAGTGQWVTGQQNALPAQNDLIVSPGFSVTAAGHRYWLIQSDPSAGSQDIDAYPASTPWGPFDRAAEIVLYRDTSIGLNAAHDYRIQYQASVEPALSTSSTLVISYNVNSEGVTTGCVPMSAYTNTVTQPRFIAVPVSVFSRDAGGPSRDQVVAAHSDYPGVAQRDPAQWFNSWSFPGGCPPVPAVTDLTARTRPGTVTLSWPDSGLGIHYRVYLLRPGAASFALATTTHASDVTLSGLGSGDYLAKVVPVNARQTSGAGAEMAFYADG